MTIEFDHVHAAHCESGAFAALLRHHGLTLTESMVFGIGSGLFFLYFPFLKLYGAPLVAYRDAPNAIISRCTRRLGVTLKKARFSNPDEGMRELDAMLARDIPVGMQTGVFWLPYFPRSMRFQFNGHHIIAYGRDRDDYLISDTVFEQVMRCPADDLRRARFSKGPLAPKGLLYHVKRVNPLPDLATAVRDGLRSTVTRMLRIPLPYMGVWGIRSLAKAMKVWPARHGVSTARSWLANVIRMQEEIGTGGAGFRFMYAAFLDEASAILAKPALHELSEQLTEAGDRWREFAVRGARVIRSEDPASGDFEGLAEMLLDCAEREQLIFRALRRAI
ncbi:MAG: BtrH N-terminal domain-containing protein [Burkholderiales bacterium]